MADLNVGTIKRTELESKEPNSWSEPPASQWLVRGPNYLKQEGKNVIELKQPSADAPYTCIGFSLYKSTVSMAHSAFMIQELREFLRSQPKDDDMDGLPSYLIICWMFSNLFQTEHSMVQHVFKRTSKPSGEDPALDAAVERFLRGNEAAKNDQLKYMFKVVSGPPAMLSAVSTLGGERPVLIGKRLTTQYHRGDNYLEIDMDVGSSIVASMLNTTILQASAQAVLDECWLFEAQREEELPERVLAVCRGKCCDPNVVAVRLDASGKRIS